MPADLLPRLKLRRPTGQVAVRPRWRTWFRQLGLRNAVDFLNLPGDIVSGHRDRHVLEVTLAGKPFYLKKEHRTPLGVRWRNWRDGFAAVSLSEREAITLVRLQRAGVSVPKCLAYGADGFGRSFLLLRRIRGLSLPAALRSNRLCALARWRVAHELGEQIARVHLAGFDAPDLSAKHVLVKRTGSVALLDWPRATHYATLDQNRCLTALASLHASLAPQLAGPRERLITLRSWMRAIGFHGPAAPLARRIVRLAENLSHRRSIREQLQPGHSPRLRWVAGEALCVTREFAEQLHGVIPDWLCDAANEPAGTSTLLIGRDQLLYRFAPAPILSRCWAWLTRRPLQSPGIRLAGLQFRLVRHRIPVAPVLAFGGRADGGGFLLCRVPPSTAWCEWLLSPQVGRKRLVQHFQSLLSQGRAAGTILRPDLVRVVEGRTPRLLVLPATAKLERAASGIARALPLRRAA